MITPDESIINISTKIQYIEGSNQTIVKPKIVESLEKYFIELRKKWENEETTIVRISQIESIILNTDGVLDISDTLINEQSSNIQITNNIAVLGEVSIL